MTKTLHIMVGLPRSGKSTVAKGMGSPIVEPDAIRKAMHGTAWRAEVEPLVWGIAHIMVDSLFIAGHDDVVIDATNHTRERRSQWISDKYAIQFHCVATDKDTCIERAIQTGQQYLVPVIERMAAQFEPLQGEDC